MGSEEDSFLMTLSSPQCKALYVLIVEEETCNLTVELRGFWCADCAFCRLGSMVFLRGVNVVYQYRAILNINYLIGGGVKIH